MQTIRQLNQMQHFDPEKTSPGIDLVPNSNELVDISFPLEEVASDKFEISGGWGLQYVRRLGRRAAEQRVAEKLL